MLEMAQNFSRKDDFSLRDSPQTGDPIEFYDVLLLSEHNRNHSVTVKELNQKVEFKSFTIICKNLERCLNLENWFPHDLTEANHKVKIDIFTSLHSFEQLTIFGQIGDFWWKI